MPESVENLMHEATERLEPRWDSPEVIRRRAERRKLRWRVTAALVTVSALGLGGIVVRGSTAGPRPPDPVPSACVADLTLPQSEDEVKLRVYHSAIGVAETMAADFRERRFDVVEVAATNESTGDFSAVIKFGPAEVGEARMVQAYLPPDLVSLDFDPNRTGPVDVILGTRFTQLNTVTEMRQTMAVLGPPRSPC